MVRMSSYSILQLSRLIDTFSGEIVATWTGNVHDIQKISGSIFFRVEIEKAIDCPEEYADYENDWYVELSS